MQKGTARCSAPLPCRRFKRLTWRFSGSLIGASGTAQISTLISGYDPLVIPLHEIQGHCTRGGGFTRGCFLIWDSSVLIGPLWFVGTLQIFFGIFPIFFRDFPGLAFSSFSANQKHPQEHVRKGPRHNQDLSCWKPPRCSFSQEILLELWRSYRASPSPMVRMPQQRR